MKATYRKDGTKKARCTSCAPNGGAIHERQINDYGDPVWICRCCNTESPRKRRRTKRQIALHRVLARLNAGTL